MKVGVLLFNLGGPETLNDVRPFLYRLFSDPEIIRIPWTPLRKIVAFLIATLRHRKSSGYYSQIGGGSPLRRLTEEQAGALAAELRKRNRNAETFVGMCTWKPFFPEALDRVQAAGVDHLVILPLFPHYSVTTTGSGFTLLKQEIARRASLSALPVTWICAWPDHPSYIAAFASAIREQLVQMPNPDSTHLLFSAHSIPESYVREGDPYLDHTKRSIEAIMERLGRKNPYQLAFQSKIGPVKWLSPMTNDVIVDLARKGVREMLVIPISFVSEHIETLYELDILYKKVADDAGVTHFRRVPALNSRPDFIRALADIVEENLKSTRATG